MGIKPSLKFVLAATILISAPAFAAQNATEEMSAQELRLMPAGTTIYAKLAKGLDARKLSPGEIIEAQTTLAVLSHGKLAIPEGSRITGHITKATGKTQKNGTSELGIVFDQVILPHDEQAELALTVQAIGMHRISPSDVARRNPPAAMTTTLEVGPGAPSAGPGGIPVSGVGGQGPGNDGPDALTLDAGSKGVIGYEDYELKEAKAPEQPSTISSTKKSVKIDSGAEIVLRVIPPNAKSIFIP